MLTRGAHDEGVSQPLNERIYANHGNPPLIDLLDGGYNRVLDVGCGAGDNAALLKSRHSECSIFGVTQSPSQAAIARQYMTKYWVIDIEDKLPGDLERQSFEVLLFSHVLEHLRDPSAVLARFSELLSSHGQVLIAVPNVLSWRMRLQFLRGDFRYRSAGGLGKTHLQFFSFFPPGHLFLAKSPAFKFFH